LFSSGNAPKLYELCSGQMGKVSPATMGAAARAGDASVAIAIRRAAEWLGIATANLVLALHPDTIILAGGVAELGDLLTGPMRETIESRVRMIPTKDLKIERSVMGDKAGLMGGIALAQRGGLKPS
jgi:glucokinase